MTSDGTSPHDSIGGSPREERLGELINEYFDRRESGENVSKDEFLAQYPEYADELRDHLGGLDLIVELGSSADGTLPGGHVLHPKGSSAQDALESDTQPLPLIPGYEIHKLIGRGGMGLVYKAMHLSTRRIVALKLLLEGPFATEISRKRFEREISLAAQLKHNNIIPIYDSGTAGGRMYYAMEHIYGLSLTDYIRANRPSITDRLKHFIKICGALTHAHLRGVIHRDLKPTNILVDAEGEPHLLDFGLAKAGTYGDMSTSLTAQIIGTPAYMSPEQAAGDPTGIDIRTDVYSLGVVLYEMLTGLMPYETNVAIGKILHNIAHADPKPPGKINPRIDGDLTAIILKSLEKNKDARYQSVESFAADVQRYLAGDPITARAPSGLYLFKKAILKHRMLFGTAAALLIMGSVTLVIIRQYSNNLAAKEKILQDQAVEKRALQEELAAKKLADEELRLKQEQAKAQFDAALNALPPDVRNTMAPLARDFAGLVAGESRITGVTELTQKVLSGLGGAEPIIPPKQQVIDPAPFMISRKPEELRKPPEDTRPALSMEEVLKAAEVLRRYQELLAQNPPSSQPASSQTATQPSDPTTD